MRYFFTITINYIYFLKSAKQLVRFKTPSNDLRFTICYKYTFIESLQVRSILDTSIVNFTSETEEVR